jgi:predicted dehydrogenase
MTTPRHLTRRHFLAQSALLTAALSPLSIAADPPGDRLRFGVIGVGGQGTANLRPHARDVVAIADVDKDHLAAAAALVEKAGGKAPLLAGDYRKLLDSKEVDAVLISTPDHWHALTTIHACQAGKDVYVEKPLTLTISEGRAMVQAARKHKRIVQTGSQQRSDDKFRKACELVRNGRLGQLKVVKVGLPGVNFARPAVPDSDPPAVLDYDFWLGPAPKKSYNTKHVHYNFRFFWDYSGGQLTNWGAHHLDIVQWALGMDESGPVTIEGKAQYDVKKEFEVPATFELIYTYTNGLQVLCGQANKGGVTFEGEKGTIFVTRGKFEATPTEIDRPAGKDEVHLYDSKSHHGNWLDCIRSRKQPICDVEIGHRSATVCHLGNIALRTGRKITWDPVKEEIVGDKEAAQMLARPYRMPWVLPTEV